MEPDNLGFKSDYETDSGRNYLVLAKEGLSNNDIVGFQIEMIAKNRITGVAELNVRELDLEIKFWYDISGLVTLSNFFKRQKVSKGDFILILNNITTTLIECKNYLLNDRFFILNESLVYINPESLQTYLIYIPCDRATELTDNFKRFTMNLIINAANIDTKDNFVQVLLQEIRREDFCLEGFRRNLAKLTREKKSGEDIFTAVNSTEKDISSKEESSLTAGMHIVVNDKEEQKPPLQSTANPPGSGFYLFMIIAAVLVIVAVKMKTEQPDYRFLTGINVDSATIGVMVLILAVVLGVAAYLKKRERSAHQNCKIGMQASIENLPDAEPFTPQPAADIYPALTYSDETVLLNNDRQDPRLVSVNSGESIIIQKPEFIVGRNRETCDYAIEHKSVGRAHATIKCESEKYYLVDMDSRNGTYINGNRLVSNKPYELTENDVLAFANVEYYFK